MLKIIKYKSLYKNLLFAVITLILLFLFWLKWLDSYTNHNEFIKVPNFNGIHLSEFDSLFNFYELQYEIIDSVFDQSRQKGVVINQDPLPNTDVKKNRKIYLTINALKIRTVNMPDVFDLTLRQAVSDLQKNGLEVGQLEYRANIATNKVLGFKINGIEIEVGQELYYGTTIDLVVGQGLSNKKVAIPNLIGLLLVTISVKHIGSGATSAFLAGVPAGATILSMLILNEFLGFQGWLGILSLTSGILMLALMESNAAN